MVTSSSDPDRCAPRGARDDSPDLGRATDAAQVGEALGAVFASVDAAGAFLRIDAVGTRHVAAGWGSLTRGSPPPRGRTWFAWSCAPRIGGPGPGRSGSILRPATPRAAVRAIELVVDAARSRDEIRRTAKRLEALDAATQAIAGVLSLDRVLQLIADRVRELIGARYAAIGIVDEDGVMERFVTSGITAEQRRRIGPLPRGHGLLGLIVRENRSYRIPEISRHPDSSGFPPHHPPMHSFLGVPIQVKGASVGQLLPDRQAGRGPTSRPRINGSSSCSRCTPGSRSRTPGSTSRSSAWPSSTSGPDRQGPPRRDHPGHLRRRPLAGGRPGADERGRGRGGGARRSGDRFAEPHRSATSATSSSGCARSWPSRAAWSPAWQPSPASCATTR